MISGYATEFHETWQAYNIWTNLPALAHNFSYNLSTWCARASQQAFIILFRLASYNSSCDALKMPNLLKEDLTFKDTEKNVNQVGRVAYAYPWCQDRWITGLSKRNSRDGTGLSSHRIVMLRLQSSRLLIRFLKLLYFAWIQRRVPLSLWYVGQ